MFPGQWEWKAVGMQDSERQNSSRSLQYTNTPAICSGIQYSSSQIHLVRRTVLQDQCSRNRFGSAGQSFTTWLFGLYEPQSKVTAEVLSPEREQQAEHCTERAGKPHTYSKAYHGNIEQNSIPPMKRVCNGR